MCGSSVASVVDESWASGPLPLIARAHQHRAGQHGGRFEQHLVVRQVVAARRRGSAARRA